MQSILSAALISVFTLFPFLDAQADYRTLVTADKLFEAGRFAEAAELYRNVVRDEPESRNGSIAAYNLGNTLFRTGYFAEAAAQFREVAHQPELPETFRSDARFNAGNTFARLALLKSDKKQKITLLKASLNEYRSALLLNPGDQDSKINYEIVLRLLKNLYPPPTSESRSSDTGPSGVSSDVASNILEQTMKEELNVLRNSYSTTSPKKKVPSNRDW